jgi:hypothetical protein
MTTAVVATTEATTAAVTALHEEDVDDHEGARPRGPHRRRSISPLPVRRHGRHHHRGSPPVVQRVIKESDGSTP